MSEIRVWPGATTMSIRREDWGNFMRNLWEARISFGYLAPTEKMVHEAGMEFYKATKVKPMYSWKWRGEDPAQRAQFSVASFSGEAWEHVSVLFIDGGDDDFNHRLLSDAKCIPAVVDGFGPVIVRDFWTPYERSTEAYKITKHE